MTLSIEDLARENAELKRQMKQMQDYNLKKAVDYQRAITVAKEVDSLRKENGTLKKENGDLRRQLIESNPLKRPLS